MQERGLRKTPALSARVDRVQGAVYSGLAARLAQYEGERYPFHVGDTWRPAAVPLSALPAEPSIHRYTSVGGLPQLRAAFAEWISARQGHPCSAEEVLITAGATTGLSHLIQALLEPGDELLLLAPAWPLMAGATRLMGATPVLVPTFGEGLELEVLLERLEAARGPKTKALYLNTPNNPTGECLPRAWLEALGEWARRHQLWVIADEVYDLYSYQGEHAYMHPLAPERTISAYSLSKSFGCAGYRIGFLQGPPDLLRAVERLNCYSLYSPSTPGQWAALQALGETGLAWAAESAASYAEVGAQVAARLSATGRVQVNAPQGSTFLFLDLRSTLEALGLSLEGFLERCVDVGLLIAPGPAFGPYPAAARLCFSATPPAQTLRGVERLARIIEGRSPIER